MSPGILPAPESEGTVLLRLNEQYLRAVERSDVGWFETHLGEDFLCSLPDGVLLDRSAFLEQIRGGSRLTAIEAHDVLIRMLGGVALVHARTTFLDGGRRSHGRYTDVWALRDRRWRAIAAHVTRC